MISFTCAAAATCVEGEDKAGNKGEGVRLLLRAEQHALVRGSSESFFHLPNLAAGKLQKILIKCHTYPIDSFPSKQKHPWWKRAATPSG